MFLIRAAFWLCIVVLLIPANPQTGESPRITMINAFLAARATVADLSGFCERNPDVCVTGNAAFELFTEKAENGARILYRYLHDPDGPDGPDGSAPSGTLTEDDLTQPWVDPSDETTA
ncbi:MAG: DUF5330 domain-containing protein [Hyphomicrobiales bacterium]|nr:DUF5330 domain-containing protein [Hyphomicrobiales bacterium]